MNGSGMARRQGIIGDPIAGRAKNSSAARGIPVQATSTRCGLPLIFGVVRACDLRGRTRVSRRDPRTKRGYQRQLAPSRVNRLVKDLRRSRVDLPTSILVNLRDYAPTDTSTSGTGASTSRWTTPTSTWSTVSTASRRWRGSSPRTKPGGAISKSRSYACSGRASAKRSASSTS